MRHCWRGPGGMMLGYLLARRRCRCCRAGEACGFFFAISGATPFIRQRSMMVELDLLEEFLRLPAENSRCRAGPITTSPKHGFHLRMLLLCAGPAMPEQTIIARDLQTIVDLLAAARMLDMSGSAEADPAGLSAMVFQSTPSTRSSAVRASPVWQPSTPTRLAGRPEKANIHTNSGAVRGLVDRR